MVFSVKTLKKTVTNRNSSQPSSNEKNTILLFVPDTIKCLKPWGSKAQL